jgi:hypothetical protein
MNKDPILLPSNRKFGYFFSVIFLVSALYFSLIDFFGLAIVFFLLFAVFLVLSYYYPNSLSKLNNYWYVLGLWIGKIVSPIVLGTIFFVLISPIAIILRWSGRDELKLKHFTFKGSSYWIDRVESIDKNSFKDQF